MLFHVKIVVKINPAKLKGLLQSMSAILKLTGILVIIINKDYLLLGAFSRILLSIYLLSTCFFFSNFDEVSKISIVKPHLQETCPLVKQNLCNWSAVFT